MNKFLLLSLVLCLFFACNDEEQQEPQVSPEPRKDSQLFVNPDALRNPYAQVDISPMDMAYFPVDYPMLKMANPSTSPPVARVIYSRPHLGGRKLFHDVLKYGETWRLGANESTELQFYRDVTIKGRRIPAGRYILYSIPKENEWTIILNSGIDSWGLKQDPAKDIARFDIPVTRGNAPLEYFTIIFEKTDSGMDLVFAWDEVMAKLPITL
jgi:hypothetical protein